MKKKTKSRQWTVYRSSITGKFITKKYAEQKPKTTVKERIEIKNKLNNLKRIKLGLFVCFGLSLSEG